MKVEDALVCSSVQLRVGHKPLLENISFVLPPGHALALVGANGTGKTTLMRVCAGVARPWSGQVSVFGEQLWPRRSVSVEPRGCYLASQPALLLDHSVHSNLEFMCNSFGLNPQYSDFDEALLAVGLAGRGEQQVRTLSTGQKRRMTLALVLVLRPGLLMADEPTNGLDEAGVQLCFEVFERTRRDRKCALLVASHDEKMIEFCGQSLSMGSYFPQARNVQASVGRLV